jgi:SAM-dependent methyltransferase
MTSYPTRVRTYARLIVRTLLYPGTNLHARERYRRVPQKFGPEIGPGKSVLDAGCGNGMLSYQAWRRGARVLGVSIKQKEVEGCRRLFNEGKGIPATSLQFENVNLYHLAPDQYQFDAIICTEVLEHIRDDSGICSRFFELLKPGGCLHITTPNATHPYNRDFPLDPEERGGHVRPGYTREQYLRLLEPLGFTVEDVCGLGGPIRQALNWRIKALEQKSGVVASIPLYLAALPFLVFDREDPPVPYCLYARARKPA